MFEWLQKVFLELEVGKLLLLKKAHRKLSQCIDSEEANGWIRMATDLLHLLEGT